MRKKEKTTNNDDDDEENDGKLTVTKIWDDGDNELNTRPDAIVVNLYANDKKIESATIMADESGEWKHVFDGLYKYADGEEIDGHHVKEMLSEIVASEEKSNPYTDEKIVELMKEKGVKLARRTIAKYRVEMGIPSVTNRRG